MWLEKSPESSAGCAVSLDGVMVSRLGSIADLSGTSIADCATKIRNNVEASSRTTFATLLTPFSKRFRNFQLCFKSALMVLVTPLT
jgi:hypothetical protein